MKKITLYLLVSFCLAFCWQGNAQLSEDFETAPPSGWTFMQTEVDDPGFVQTSDRANSGTYSYYKNDDNLASESTAWMISPAYTVNSGDMLSFFYNNNYVTLGYGVESGVWISTASGDPIANPGDFTLLFDILGNATEDVWTEHVENLDSYAGQTIYIAFKYVGDFEDELYIDDFSIEPAPTDTLDYYNLQWPANGTINAGDTFDVYAQAYEAGLTDVTSGQAPGIEAWIGYSTSDTDPSGAGWTWIAANFNTEVGNNDEYMLNLGAAIFTPGTYYYASRWSLNSGPYTYGGYNTGAGDGAWDGTDDVSGVLTVNTPPGATCGDPIAVSSLPYNTSGNTAYYGDDYSGSPGASGCGTTNNYLNGDDIVYAYTATSDTSINIAMSAIGSTYSGVFVYTDCADIGTACVAGYGNGSSTADYDFDVAVTNGTTYYIVISTWATPQSTTYTLDITENTCTDATVAYTVIEDCAVSGGFYIDVDITDMGSATNITLSDDQASPTIPVTTTGTYQFGPYTLATPVVISVSDDSNSSCDQSSSALTLTVCPPSNDLFANAIAINCGDDVTGTTLGATQDESGAPSVATVETDTSADNDSPWVWYSYTGSGGAEEITLSTCGTAQTDFDTEIFVYTGTSGALTLIDDGYDECGGSSENYAAETTFTSDGTTTYYIAVGGYDSDDVGNFHLAINCVTLSVDSNDLGELFSYYPNPVNSTLTLKAQKNIERVIVYNMVGQQVLRTAPNTVTNELDMSNLATGSYFVEVSVEGVSKTIRIIKQ